MFGTIALFELRYQFRNPVFWVATILFFLLTFGATTVESIRLGSGGNVHTNAPIAVAQIQLILSLFFMFVTTAFVGSVVVRDDETGFGSIVRSTSVGKLPYMLGRFTGAFVGAAVAFTAVPLAIWIGTYMPWVDVELLGQNRLYDYVFGYVVFALPNLLITSSIFFAVACWTRSLTYSFLTVILFMFVYFALTAIAANWPELSLMALLEPFGMIAFGLGIRYLTPIQANVQSPDLTGLLIANRLLWIAISAAFVTAAVWRFRFSDRAASARVGARATARARKLAAAEPVIVDRLPDGMSAGTTWHQVRARTYLEMKLIFNSPAFWVLAIVGSLNLLVTLNLAGRFYGVPIWPRTFAIIETVRGASSMLTLLMVIYFAGEVVWRDRERRFSEIIDATPLRNWIFLVSKLVGVVGALMVLTVAIVLMESILFQLARGITDIEFGRWVVWFVVPAALYVAQLTVLAIVVQAVSPNKFVGWAIMLLYLVAGIVMGGMGLEHPMLIYAEASVPVSDMNGADYGGAGAWWLRFLWTTVALVLLVIGHLMWRRGTAITMAGQWRTLPARLRGRPLALLVVVLMLASGTGGFLFYNMNVLNSYRSGDDMNDRLARYERAYSRYVDMPQPTLTDVKLKIDLKPSRGAMVVDGAYRYANMTKAPIATLHVRTMPGLDLPFRGMTVPNATLLHADEQNHYRIYRFTRPLRPGARGMVFFRTAVEKRGLSALPSNPQAHETDAQPAANGTYVINYQILPLLGMNRTGFLTGRRLRQEHGLAADPLTPDPEDRMGRIGNYAGLDRVNTDITVTTDADQTLVATGARLSDTVTHGRRTARFISPSPSFNFIMIQSARYDVRTANAGNVKLQVYYHPQHLMNVDRMLRVMRESLDYYRNNFGPYQYPYARIVERPGYGGGANSAAGTIGFSERVGFIMDLDDPKRLDFVAYITAHELAHQYWFHQVMPADAAGAELLTEGLAQYSALMVMKRRYGEDQIRVFLKYELDQYLKGRRMETSDEKPLGRTRNQGYIHYNKASVVMYLLQNRLGENRVNAMLRTLLNRYRFKSAPYAQSRDLVDGFLSLARTPGERQLIIDQFDRITLYDLKVKQATVRRLPNGRFETTMTVNAGKVYADGRGNERQALFDEPVDIGLFTARPGESDFDRGDVVSMRRVPVRSGEQKLRIVTSRRPLHASIDPYIGFIDRNSNDNIVKISEFRP